MHQALVKQLPFSICYRGKSCALISDYLTASRSKFNRNRTQEHSWSNFYDQVISLTEYTFSWQAMIKRFGATRAMVPRWMNLVRAVSSEGFGRIRYYAEVRRLLDTDRRFQQYFEQETTELPEFFSAQVRRDLGSLYDWLPLGALFHDPNAYSKAAVAAA